MSRFNDSLKRLTAALKGKVTLFAVLMGGLGILLLCLSGGEKAESAEVEQELTAYSTAYAEHAEEKLSLLLSGMEGVGETSVLIRVACTEEYVYLCEDKRSYESDGDSMHTEDSAEYVIAGSDKSAILTRVIFPEISGCVIVCEGGGSSVVREAVTKAAAAALDIPISSIYVSAKSR